MLPQKKRFRYPFYALVLLVILILLDQLFITVDRRIAPAYDTTRITSPFKDGYPDYVAALNQSAADGATPENNAAPLLFEITGTDYPDPWKETVYRQWHLPVPSAPPLFRNYAQWVAAQPATAPATSTAPRPGTEAFNEALEDELDAAAKSLWSPTDHPQLARWLQSCDPTFAKLDEACARPRFYIPQATKDGRLSAPANFALIDIMLPRLGTLRALAPALTLRAMLHLHDHDAPAFQHDILLAMKLARLETQNTTLIQYLVALATDAYVLKAVQQAAITDNLDAAQCSNLQKAILSLPPFTTPAAAIDRSERFFLLDTICSTSRKVSTSGDTYGSDIQPLYYILPVNYNAALRESNFYFDQMTHAWDLPTFSQRHDVFQNLNHTFEAKAKASLLHRVTHLHEYFLLLLLPSFDKTVVLHTNHLTDHNLALTALALRSHKLQTGNYPNSLADLPPSDFLLDPFTNTPLTYHRKAAGYLLYSLAENQKDDGATPKSPTHQKDYDIVLEAPQ